MTRNLTTRRQLMRRATASLVLSVSTLSAVIDAGSVQAGTNYTTDAGIATNADAALVALSRWERSGTAADRLAYERARDAAAELIAGDLGLKAVPLRVSWASADLRKQKVVLAALSQIGVPYRTNASEEGVGFDCSGLMLYAFGRAGIDLPRISRDQIDAADEVAASAADPGDLVFYPGHISLFIGEGLMVHSPNSGNVVEVRTIPDRSLSYGDMVAVAGSTQGTPVARGR